MTREITEDNYKKLISRMTNIVIAAFIIGGIIGYTVGYFTANNEKVASATTQPFDHSNCQYPERWSNPVDGCDNSDPAVPECIKQAYSQESERDCIDAFVKKYQEQPQAPVSNPTSPTTPELKQPVNTCGGK